nr:hypothetical protein [Corynebacterium sp. UBA5992]
MKKLTPLFLALPLLLAACGSNEPTPEEIQSSEAQAILDSINEDFPSEGVTPNPELVQVKSGDSITLSCYNHQPCDGTLALESVTMSDRCEGRVDSYGMGPELEEGQTYLQVKALFDLKSSAIGWSMLDDPQIIDKEGLTQSVGMAINCHENGEYQLWSSTLDAGQKAKHFGVWIVPEDAEYALLEGAKLELPKADSGTEIDDNA